ncbi:hypothetical protein [Marinobacterium lutimaris]|uniref:Uncharacterized protein n=1 Tax=Marinobacterium lutimaris TaxID=568106 RepID=A0A1H5VT51_9GAMM|nr:hypothetical protein [Marinobacterium lutimaris]SEF90313.1 hypothetical protein SAMN05444390_101829 [Marinobacterium lutimaris]
MNPYLLLRTRTKEIFPECFPADKDSRLERQSKLQALRARTLLSPEERLFLFRLCELYQRKGAQSLTWTVRKLAAETHSTSGVTSYVLQLLKNSESLVSDLFAATGGRPKKSYIFTPKFSDPISNRFDRREYIPIRKLQKFLISAKSENNAGDKIGRASSWLLAVMLEHADEKGRLDALSHSDIRDLTGMTSERLRSQIRTLMKHGFIRAVVPGANGHVFCRKANTVYHLNLFHPFFGASRISGFHLVIHRCTYDQGHPERWLEGRTDDSDGVFVKLYLQDLAQEAVRKRVQSVLDYNVSEMLSRYKGFFGPFDGSAERVGKMTKRYHQSRKRKEQVELTIEGFVRMQSACMDKESIEAWPSLTYDAFLEQMTIDASSQARIIRDLLKHCTNDLDGQALSDFRFSILPAEPFIGPTRVRAKSLRIDVFPTNTESVSERLWVCSNASGKGWQIRKSPELIALGKNGYEIVTQ